MKNTHAKKYSQTVALAVVAKTEVALTASMPDDFTAAYDLYHDAILRYFSWKCSDRETSHDLTQETFLRLWVCINRKEKIQHIRGFLYHIAHNLFIDHVRGKKNASLDEMLEQGFQPSNDPWHQTINELDSESVLKKLGTMNPYRHVLHQRFILGLTPAQIAVETGENSNTVSVRIFRGLKHVRGMLNNKHENAREALLGKLSAA